MFSNDQVAEVSLEAPVKTLDAVQGDKVDTRFLAGSCSVQDGDTNHLFVLRHANDKLTVDARIPHETGPVAKISTSPSDKTVVLTYPEDAKEATLWKLSSEAMNLSEDESSDFDNADVPLSTETMTAAAKLEMLSQLVDMVWRSLPEDEPTSAMGDVFTMDQTGNISQWDVAFGAAESTRQMEQNVESSKWNLPPRLACDPHNSNAMAVASGSQVHMVDWRTTTDNTTTCHHRYGITSLDFNPNKPHVLATGGQDGLIKFWDLRSSRQPLMVSRGGHRHWVSLVKYNPFHDQLLLSAGTDSLVNLWRFSTISSAPLLTMDDEAEDPATADTSGPNVRVTEHEHLDSVYATAWGASDAWVYASVGYDGKAMLSHVPSKEKYKILL